jgi:hypothetical protein
MEHIKFIFQFKKENLSSPNTEKEALSEDWGKTVHVVPGQELLHSGTGGPGVICIPGN